MYFLPSSIFIEMYFELFEVVLNFLFNIDASKLSWLLPQFSFVSAHWDCLDTGFITALPMNMQLDFDLPTERGEEF